MHWARFGAHSTLVERRRGAACAEGASGGTWRHVTYLMSRSSRRASRRGTSSFFFATLSRPAV